MKEKDSIDGISQISQDDAILVSYKKDPNKEPLTCSGSNSYSYVEKERQARASKDGAQNFDDKSSPNGGIKDFSTRYEDVAKNQYKSKDSLAPRLPTYQNVLEKECPINQNIAPIKHYGSATKVNFTKEPKDLEDLITKYQQVSPQKSSQNTSDKISNTFNFTYPTSIKIEPTETNIIIDKECKDKNIWSHGEKQNSQIVGVNDTTSKASENNKRDNCSSLKTFVLPSNLGKNTTIVEIGSSKSDPVYLPNVKNGSRQVSVPNIFIDKTSSQKDEYLDSETALGDRHSDEPQLLAPITSCNKSKLDSSPVQQCQVLEGLPTQKDIKETEEVPAQKFNQTNDYDGVHVHRMTEGVADVGNSFNNKRRTTTTKTCINNFKPHDTQNHSDTTCNINRLLDNDNNCLTPTKNEVYKLDVKTAPTIECNDNIKADALLPSNHSQGTSDESNDGLNKQNADNNVGCIDISSKDVDNVHMDDSAKFRETVILQNKPNPSLPTHNIDLSQPTTKLILAYPKENFIDTSLHGNDNSFIDAQLDNSAKRNGKDTNHMDANNKNAYKNGNERNFGVVVKDNDEAKTNCLLQDGEDDGNEKINDDFSQDLNDESTRKPKISKSIHEKIILFDSKVLPPSTNSNLADISVKQNESLDSPGGISAKDIKMTSNKLTYTRHEDVVKHLTYKMPLPTEIKHILETGSIAPHILSCQNMDEFSTNANNGKGEILSKTIINATEYDQDDSGASSVSLMSFWVGSPSGTWHCCTGLESNLLLL